MACANPTEYLPISTKYPNPPPRSPIEIPPGAGFRPNQAFKNERLQKQKTFTPLGESYTSLFHRLIQLGMLNPIEPKLPNPPPRNLDHSVSCEYCSGAPGHDTEKCWKLKTAIQELIDTHRIEVQDPEVPNINQNPLSAHHETNMIEIVHKAGEPKKPSQTVMMFRSCEVRTSDKSTSGKSLIKLKETDSKPVVVVQKESSSGVAVKQEKVKVVVPGAVNKSVVVVEGARKEPVISKPVTQLPIVNSKAVPWNYGRMTVTYKGKEVKEEVCETHGLTRSGRCFAPEELRKAKTSKDNPVLVKKAVTEEEAEEFLKKMKMQDYSIVEQLWKTPALISVLSLLIHSDEHRRALMKILNEAHVPDKISVNDLEKIANKIFEVNRVTFFDDELPMEGTEHNRALYLTVKCEDSVVTRVLIDNGSSTNICPLSTLDKLKVDNERIHKHSICVRGFDGGGKDSVRDIVPELTIGPVEFTMEFQVLNVAVSYNLLLGRPWIHAAKAVLSTLHQMVKFEWDRQEIVVHGEDGLCAQNDSIIPFIEVEDDKGPWVYQVFGAVSVENIPEGECVPVPKVAAASVMVASEMLKNGFVPGKGLGASLQGIVQPVSLPKNLDTFGLGFKPITADIRRARKLKQRAWFLPKPVPCLSRSFVRPGTKKRPWLLFGRLKAKAKLFWNLPISAYLLSPLLIQCEHFPGSLRLFGNYTLEAWLNVLWTSTTISRLLC
ncbi:PREDICTED: uncharacterized protein LOC109240708 [Nicotiana attenuata]|uniref:uncharacterized protein LOC109240708 n=1 Tax=Nicotiana attenuata TaxID=49451 RepID=UPI00090468AC|nr:PREDICTED: uncharacterized protein LOC109240708 [Nicotiana attenuata]